MTNITFLLAAVTDALLFGANSRIKCEILLNNLKLDDFEDYSIQDLKQLTEKLKESKPKFDDIRKTLQEKTDILNKSYERLTKLYYGIQDLMTEKGKNEGDKDEKESLKGEKGECFTKIPAEEEDDPDIELATPTQQPHPDVDTLVQKDLLKETVNPVFQMDTTKMWKIDYIVDLYEKLTHHRTNQFEILKAAITFDFDGFRKNFRSRNLFFVWMNTLFLSDLITSQREWLKCILPSGKIKLFRDALRKCRNKHVLKCCQNIEIALNFNQRMWSERKGGRSS